MDLVVTLPKATHAYHRQHHCEVNGSALSPCRDVSGIPSILGCTRTKWMRPIKGRRELLKCTLSISFVWYKMLHYTSLRRSKELIDKLANLIA